MKTILDAINEAKQDEQNLIDFAGESLAKRFLNIKHRLKSPENDIYYWLKKDVVELEDKVNEIENTVSKTKQKEIEKTEGAELVAEENGWKVYRIDTYEASCLYGKGTKWCTASTETSSHFNDYKENGIKLYYFIKNNEKYALALYPKIASGSKETGIKSNYELYDATDKLIKDPNQIKSLNLPKIPGVDLILEVLPTKIEGDVLVKVYPYNQGEFVIPEGIKTIGDKAFSGCYSLTSITIPNSVITIGEYAFYYCISLKSITISSSVTSIGYSAFSNCTSLKSITIPSSVTSIDNGAFDNCQSLTSITIPSSVTKIGEYAFSDCFSLTSIIIPDSVTSIGKWAFYNCKSLKSITIPSSVTSIGEYAFYGCYSLKSITIPRSVTSIGKWAFGSCHSLTSITIPNSVTSIGEGAFASCLSLKSITIPSSVTSISDYAFYDCPSLTIYAEAPSKPTRWNAQWNPDNRPVIWNYKNSANSNNINESKADDEYNKFWSMIDRDVFNNIVLADPKTSSDADGIKMIGFVAKQLLLPKYRDGEKDFIDDLDAVKDAIQKYQQNPGKYAKLSSFSSVSDFIKYMDDPESVSIEEPTKQVDPITAIYNQYYQDIKREDFDKIIAMDPKTTDKSIGEIAKNILLINFRKKEETLSKAKTIAAACEEYYKIKDKLPLNKQQLGLYSSTAEFVDYILKGPESSLVAALKANTEVDPKTKRQVKDDVRIVATTFDYDILEPKSHRAAAAISGGYNTPNGMRWCTAWEPDDRSENDSYWRRYTADGGRIFCFMHKTRNRGSENRVVNWQVHIRNNQIGEFLNGNDDADYPGENRAERFKNFLFAHLDIFRAIKGKEPFNTLPLITEIEAQTKYMNEPFILDSDKAVAILEAADLSKVCKEIIISIPKIPVALCASFISLKTVTFKEGVKEIGDQAFMNCPNLNKVVFPESLEIIGRQAFQNCLELKGSIRVPDNVKEIRTHAFAQDKCKLKINKNRTTKLKFDVVDKDWVTTHVQTITFN